MLAILFIIEPSFETAIPVFLDFTLVAVNGGLSRDGDPITCLGFNVPKVDIWALFAAWD